MNKREKTLAIALGSVLVVGTLFKLVYPNIIKPMFDYGGRLAAAQAEREELAEEFETLENQMKDRYHAYVLRTGSTETSVVSDELQQRINTELSDAQMLSGSTVTPRTPSVDKRTKVATLRLSVSAPGSFAQCIQFIRGVYRMPYIVRFNSIKLSPIGRPQQRIDDRVKLDAEIEVAILPHEKLLGAPAGDKPQPLYSEERLAFKDYRKLEAWKPFIPYSKPSLPKATPEPEVTSAPTPPTPPPPPPGAPTSPDADSLIVRGHIGYGVDEVMLFNVMDDEMSYIAVGEQFDAGELVLAHALGAVAHKVTDAKDFGYFVYPLGQSLAERIRLEDASQWPEIQVAMKQYFEARRGESIPADEDEVDEEEAQASKLDELDAAVAMDMVAESAFVGPPYVTGPDMTTIGQQDAGHAPRDTSTNGISPAFVPKTIDIPGGTTDDAPQPKRSTAVQDREAEKVGATSGTEEKKQPAVRPITRKPHSKSRPKQRTPSRRRKPVGRKNTNDG